MAANYSTKESHLSLALQVALGHVKSFMTENQKSNVLLREGRVYMDQGDLHLSLIHISEPTRPY